MKFRGRSIFTILIGLLFVGALINARSWPIRASILIFVLGGGVALPLIIIMLYMELRPEEGNESSGMDVPLFKGGEPFRDLKTWGWLFGLLIGTWLLGFMAAVPIFTFVFSFIYGARWYTSIFLAAGTLGLLYGLFDLVVNVSWPEPFLLSLLGL
jgi:hypothetical protein